MTLPLPPILRLLTPDDPELTASLAFAYAVRRHVRAVNEASAVHFAEGTAPWLVLNGVDLREDERRALVAVGEWGS